jgi:hypothetical protein
MLAAASAASQSGTAQGAVARHPRGRSTAGDPIVTIGPTLPVQPVGSTFLGFSFEYWALRGYAGTNPHAIDPVFEQLISNLTAGAPTVIRIGGVSTDRTWWPIEGLQRSPAAWYTLTRRRLEVAAALATATNAQLIMGVNLESDSSIEAAAETHAMMTLIGPSLIDGIELGNEPELYGSRWFYRQDGQEYFARPPTWGFQSFMSDYLNVAATLGDVPLAGPAVGAYTWLSEVGAYLDAEHVAVVTLHRYPLQSCGASPGQSNYPSIPNLLSSASSVGLADGLQPYVALAHAHGEVVRNAEMNSVSCGTARGSANTFAGALWVLDALFAMASVGVDGVNIHTYSGAADQLFSIKHVGSRWRAYVAPEYYGVLMFSQAAPPGSQLLHVSGLSGLSTLRAWATVTPTGQTNLVLINDATDRPESVTVRLPERMSPPTVERLEAPSVDSTTRVTIGGETFGSQTTTGLLSRALRGETLRRDKPPSRARTYRIQLPAASAAMLTFG